MGYLGSLSGALTMSSMDRDGCGVGREPNRGFGGVIGEGGASYGDCSSGRGRSQMYIDCILDAPEKLEPTASTLHNANEL